MKEGIRIANPIYDVVFRYLMEDNKVAKLVLSAIIGEEIEELTFSPTEYSKKVSTEISITLIRMDFSAKIKQSDGKEKIVIIELQKAKYYHQTMRFRRYIGKQYQNPENINEQEEALPIYPIYILGEEILERKAPVIKINRVYIDLATNEIIEEQHPFIEALTHDAIVIQIPHLKGKRRTELELFLSIFDQSQRVDGNRHVLILKEEDYPEKYHAVIRRLNKALQSPEIEEDMIMEDDVIHEFNKMDEKTEEQRKRAEAAERQAEEQRQRAEEQRQRAEEERQRAEEERQSKYQIIKNLAKKQFNIQEIAAIAGLEIAEVQQILEEKE